MKFWLKYSLKELLYSKSFSFFYILTLVLSASGLTLIVFFGGEIKSQVEAKAKSALAADFSVSARRAIEEKEIQQIENEFKDSILQSSHSYEFFAMMSYAETARLVLVKVIDSNYPLYGKLEVNAERSLVGRDLKSGQIWFSKDAVRAIGLQKNEKVQLGSSSFTYTEEIGKDPTQTFRFGLLAPKVYILIDDLKQTKLIQSGSTFTDLYLYKLNDKVDAELSKNLQKKFIDPSLRFSNFQEASENANRQLTLFADFLSLAALISFLIGLLGVYYINLNFIKQKTKNISLLKFLGASHESVKRFIFIELTVLLTFSVGLSSLILYWLLPFSLKYASEFFDIDSQTLQISKLFLISLALNTFAVVLSIFPFLDSLKKVSPKALLSESSESLVNVKTKLFMFLVLVVLTAMSLLQSRSFRFSIIFILSLIFAYACSFLPFLLFQFIKNHPRFQSWKTLFVIENINASRFSYQTVFAALITAVMFSTALPLIQRSLENELRPTNSRIPALFLFDIQEEQLPEVKTYLEKISTQDLFYSNLIRARIIKVNDVNFERQDISSLATREEEAESRMRNRGINISVREKLSDSEKLVDGKLWSDPNLTEVSIEQRYMDRLKLKMGDKLLFDIQGIEIEATITSVRKVNWNSFSPNFFILFEPGFIDEAPKTYLTSLQTKEDKILVQTTLFKMFPNISVIDFETTLTEALAIVDKISLAFNFLAAMTLVMGIFLFALIVMSLMTERWQQWALLRALGGLRHQLNQIFGGELIVLICFSLFIGFLLSGLLTLSLVLIFFEAEYLFPYDFYLKYTGAALGLSILFFAIFFKYLNSKKVLDVLKS